MRLQLLLASVFIAPASANADIVLGNQPTLAGTSAIVGGTLDVRRAVGFTMDNQDFLLESVDISLNHEPTRSAPVVELYAGNSVWPFGIAVACV